MRREVAIGIMALVTFVVALWGYYFLKGSNLIKQTNTYYAYYDDVKELTEASAVTISGYKVGTITDITLNPEDVSQVKVTFDVKNDFNIPANTVATIRNSSLMGGKELILQFDRMCGNGIPCAQNGQELQGKKLGMIGSMVDFSEADPIVGSVEQSVDAVLSKIKGENGDGELYQTYHKLDEAIANMATLTKQMSHMMSKSSKSLEATMQNLSVLTGNLANNNAKINAILGNMDKASQDFAALNLSATTTKANATLDETKVAITQLQEVANSANTTVKSLETVINKIDKSEGSLGQLVNDKDLYNNLESTSQHLSLLLQDLRLNPKRYVNVSVFGKKGKQYTKPADDPGIE